MVLYLVRRRVSLLIVAILPLVALGFVVLVPPIPQDPAYHRFADQRDWLGIPNFANVVSNLGFAIVGIMGLLFLRRRSISPAGWPFAVLFVGVTLTAFGSGYYHLAPANDRLVWDRLPMTVVFMSLFALSIEERVDERLGLKLLVPLVALGVASVGYWYLGEVQGAGDLRFYAIVQFLPMVTIPLLLVSLPERRPGSGNLWGAIALYLVAKVFELFDESLFAAGEIISGHTLKHLAATAATFYLYRMMQARSE